MTGGIIPNCPACNDLGKDPNGCNKCGTLGPAGRKAAKDTANRAASAKKIQPKGAATAAATNRKRKKR